MSSQYSEKELVAFHDYAVGKGLMNPATAQSRKIAATKILSALDDEEKRDLRNVDREIAFHRFVNKHGKGFTPESLKTYRSRFINALDDFIRYTDNPAGFRPGPVQREKRSEDGAQIVTSKTIRTTPRARASVSEGATGRAIVAVQPVVFPIPIRGDVTVRIYDLPRDLTSDEADKIAAVVKALATPSKGAGK